jgi:hypothetical protein
VVAWSGGRDLKPDWRRACDQPINEWLNCWCAVLFGGIFHGHLSGHPRQMPRDGAIIFGDLIGKLDGL